MTILKVFLALLAIVTKIRSQTDNNFRTYTANYAEQVHFTDTDYRPTRLRYENEPRYAAEYVTSNVNMPSKDLQPPYITNNAIVNSVALPNGVQKTYTPERKLGHSNHKAGDYNPSRKEQSFALMNFGLNLITELGSANNRQVSEPNSGVIVSPFSIAGLLALLMQGAVGSTQLELAKVLNMRSEDAALLFQRVGDIIKKRSSPNIFEIATNIFLSQNFDLNSRFKSIAINSFGSDITQISFNRPDWAAEQINNWVSTKTKNKIREIVNPGTLSENTDIVLVNALYFKGIWQKKFNVASTAMKPFYLKTGEVRNTPFMRTRNIFKIGHDLKSKSDIIILPFEGEDYSLMIALPNASTTLDIALETFTKATLKDYRFTLRTDEIDLRLPKFTVKSNFDIKPVLQRFDLMETFSESADFSGIGTQQNKPPLISSAVHSAILAIDEDGATAAASTAFAAVALINEEIPIITVDRPFLAIIWDNRLNIPLFVGRIEDPSK